MGITFGEAIKNVFSFIIGNYNNNEHSESNTSHMPDELPLPGTVHCKKCDTVMRRVHQLKTDFIILNIFECPECQSISEFQYNSETKEMARESYIYDNKITKRSSIISEAEGFVKYENFSLDKLWVVCGHLCYPALIKSEFTNGASLIFVKCDKTIGLNCVDGYMINAQNVVGEIRMFNDQNISHFYNPYLANLPHKNFNYMSYSTPRCDALERVDNIRFEHTEEGHDGVYMHKLTIIKDLAMKTCGFEVYVRFYTFGDKFHKHTKISTFLKGIRLEDIIMGNENIEVSEEYSIQSHYLNKHTLSSVNRIDISKDERRELYNDIIKFFNTYDQYNT